MLPIQENETLFSLHFTPDYLFLHLMVILFLKFNLDGGNGFNGSTSNAPGEGNNSLIEI